jgi:glutamate decarboxylase
MPADAEDVAVLRIVVREGFSADLARMLHVDLVEVCDELRNLGPGKHSTEKHFAH